jgi:hypothetical protein
MCYKNSEHRRFLILVFFDTEPVAYAPYRFNENAAGNFYFASETSDMHIDGAVTAVIIITPHFIQQRLAGKNALAVAGKKFKQSYSL